MSKFIAVSLKHKLYSCKNIILKFFIIQYVSRLYSLIEEIYTLPNLEYFNLIRLDCEDLKLGMVKECKRLANTLLEALANKMRAINRE